MSEPDVDSVPIALTALSVGEAGPPVSIPIPPVIPCKDSEGTPLVDDFSAQAGSMLCE